MLTLRGHPAGVFDIKFSPDGRHLAAAGDGRPSVMKLWDAGR